MTNFSNYIIFELLKYTSGWGGAAAMYTQHGQILTSVAPEVINAST